MRDRFFYDADGELLIVPQLGTLRLHTELGVLDVAPGEICLVPRGVKFRVELLDGQRARLRLRELRPARCGCRTSARLARSGWPTRATSRRRSPPTRIVKATSGWWRSTAAACGRPRSITRRSTSSPGAATTCRTSTTSTCSSASTRSRSTTPIRRSTACWRRRRAVPGTANVEFGCFPPRWIGRRAHVPPAAVPPQRGQRVPRADSRSVHRQGRGVRPGQRQPAQLHVGARTRRRGLRARAAAPS